MSEENEHLAIPKLPEAPVVSTKEPQQHSGPGAKPNHWAWDVWVAIATAISGLCLAWISSQLPTEEIWKRALTRSLVPVLTPFYHHPDGNPITIVTISDDDLKSFQMDWPLPLDFLARRLDRILALDPQAVFIDLLFVRQRSSPEIEALKRTLCRSKRPVFIAVEGISAERSDVEKELFKARRADGKTPCALPVNATITPDELDQLQWAYPMHIGEPVLGHADTGTHPSANKDGKSSIAEDRAPPNRSAALEIYCHLYIDKCPDKGKSGHELEPLALVWPARSAKTNNDIMIAPVAMNPKSSSRSNEATTPTYEPICRNGVPLWESIPLARPLINWVRSFKQRVRDLPPCAYHQVVPLRAFNRLQIDSRVNAADSAVDQIARNAAPNGDGVKVGFGNGELGSAIGNKIVLIGGDIYAAGDTIMSPVHGVLPGVHAHAMALDNLIAFDGAYKEYNDFDPKKLSSSGSLFVSLSIFLIVIVLALWHRYFPEPPRWTDMPARTLTPVRRFWAQITMILLSLFQLILGKPKFKGGDAAVRRVRITHHVTFAVVNAVLVAILFISGYWFFRQGPLSMVEYVLFPFFAHFLHLGELVAHRGLRWWRAFNSEDPWRQWSATTSEVSKAQP